MKKLSILFFAVLFIVCVAAQAFAAVSSINNNFTMINGAGGLTGGTNDVLFTWDGTMKTAVAASGQVSNSTLSSVTPFFSVNWAAHDVAIYGPGTYTVYTDCPAGSPGCGVTTNSPPITFTVGVGQLGVHMLFDWGGNNDIDVVDVWTPNSVFGPSSLFTGPDGGTVSAATIWSLMSSDWDGDGMNGYPMVDGPFAGFNASFNVNYVGTANNNFTMINGSGGLTGGTNDVMFTWNGTMATSVAASGQVPNATLSSVTPFFGVNWSAHDVEIYGPGTYTVYSDCPAGSPGCGTTSTPPITFTVGAGQLGVHILFDWGGSNNIDVVDVWTPRAVFGPSPLFTGPDGGTVDPAKVWDWMSSDWNADGFNGYPMVDGPFAGFNASFNTMGVPPTPGCVPANCDDGNACTTDSCVSGVCHNDPIVCNDNNICTADTCNPATGCVFTPAVPVSCNDNNICTTDGCTNNACTHTAVIPVSCNDSNICTTDGCTNNACTHTAVVPASCNDSNICTTDGCTNNACTHTAVVPASCNDNNACTTDGCTANACTHVALNCDDRNICTNDSCNTATGCVNTLNASICMIGGFNNNFTMVDPTGKTIGGTNDVIFAWDGTKKTSVAASGQVGNAVLSSTCPFQGLTWSAHDVAIYSAGSYTVFAGCTAGNPGCGTGTPIHFTVGAGQLGVHMLFNWGVSTNIDVVDVFTPGTVFAPSALWTAACGSQAATKVWDWMSSDWNGDGKNGYPMVDGPFLNFNANFNVMGIPVLNCDDNNACTTDSQVGAACVHTAIVCNDNNACTTDSCNPASGCVFTPVSCPTGQICDPATGNCVAVDLCAGTVCNDNNACTTDTCNSATGCVYTPISCDDNNACTADSCNPATGCAHAAISCDDRNVCTTDTCNPATGCVNTNNPAICPAVQSNNFTMLDPGGNLAGGTNDVAFAWDGTRKTSVAVSGQVGNATLSSGCPFFGVPWMAHDLAIYGPGTYTIYSGCPAGSPGCGIGAPINFTVGAGQIGGHLLFDWGPATDIDVVNVWAPNAAFGPSAMWTGACGSNPANTVWTWMSTDFNGDGINGTGMVDGPFPGFNASFNLISKGVCADAATRCNDNNACTTDTCDSTTGACIHTAVVCNDNSVCTTDTCSPASGCVFTPINCNDNNACTTDTCDAVTGCVHTVISCGDNNPCTTDTCNPASGCSYAPIVCNDNNACTADTCNTATGCVFTPIVCNDNNACTTDTCNTATGCVYTPISCNDNNACTADSCNSATGCVNTPISCDDNNACTADSCNPATGCAHAAISCDDRNACTTDTCNPATGCVNTNICTAYQNNNFTMLDPGGNLAGGTNDVAFAWDGTKKTSVAVSGQVGNATLSSGCPFFGVPWMAHDLAIYGPGTYTVYSGCPAGSPGCGIGAPINFTVGAGQIGGHLLFDWGPATDIDVVNVWAPNAAFGPSAMWTGACGSNAATTKWTWMSTDFNGDGINGTGMVDGPFPGFNASFNLIALDPCFDAATRCNDNNACTIDTCVAGVCHNDPIVCNDNNACTTDACVAGACVYTAISCDDNNVCTTDTCNTATGCVHTAISCNDNNACTIDQCDPVSGCVHYPMPCNDNNACTNDTCNPATGCVFTPIVCNDNNACTIDTCNTASGCVYTPRVCNDNNLCTTDSCDPAVGCVFTALPVSSDNNPCTNDSCNPATGLPVYTNNTAPCDDGLFCNGADTCSGGTCSVHSGNPCTGTMTCDEATDTCTCPKSVIIRGGGQKPNGVDLQIETAFTVTNGGCLLDSTASSVTFSVGSTVSVDWHKGTGPSPTSGTWNSASVQLDTPFSIVCSTAGQTGKLVLTNSAASGGKDTDRITVNAQ